MYEILYTPTFEESFNKIDKNTRNRIKEKLKYLSQNPNIIKRLKYSPRDFVGLCKYRVGDWRILFWTDHNKKEITLYLVDHRGSIYKNL